MKQGNDGQPDRAIKNNKDMDEQNSRTTTKQKFEPVFEVYS
jgi:hypothetical protein